jgi:hypothetical protein
MACRAFGIEQVEQVALFVGLPPHCGKPSPLKASSRRIHCSSIITSPLQRNRSKADSHCACRKSNPDILVVKSPKIGRQSMYPAR